MHPASWHQVGLAAPRLAGSSEAPPSAAAAVGRGGAPRGMHSIQPLPSYAPSFPSAGVYAVAQAMPQPPPRASHMRVAEPLLPALATGAAPTPLTPLHSSRADKAASALLSRQLHQRNGAQSARGAASPRSYGQAAEAKDASSSAEQQQQQQPFVFRSIGRPAAASSQWLSEQQQQQIEAERVAREAAQQRQREAERAAAAHALQRQRAMLMQSSLFLSPSQVRVGFEGGGISPRAPAGSPKRTISFMPATPPAPSGAQPHSPAHAHPHLPQLRPMSTSGSRAEVDAGRSVTPLAFTKQQLLSHSPSAASYPFTIVSAARTAGDQQSLQPQASRQPAHSQQHAPSSERGGPTGAHEEVFVIRPSSRPSPRAAAEHRPRASSAHPAPVGASPSPPGHPPSSARAHSASGNRSHILRSGQAHASLANLFPHPTQPLSPSQGRAHTQAPSRADGSPLTVAAVDSGHPQALRPLTSPTSSSAAAAAAAAGAGAVFSPTSSPRKRHVTNTFVLRAEGAAAASSAGGEYPFPSPLQSPTARSASDAAAAASGGAGDARQDAADGEEGAAARGFALSPTSAAAQEASLAASRASEAVLSSREAERLKRLERAQAEEQAAAEAARRARQRDDHFVRQWALREHDALPLLLQYLASPAGRSLLVSKPAHGFLVDDSEAFLRALRRIMRTHFPAVMRHSEAEEELVSSSSSSSSMKEVAGGTTAALVSSDVLLLLSAVGGSALLALWCLDKWRLANVPLAATGVLQRQQHFAAPLTPPTKFAHVAEMAVALRRTRERITHTQQEWMHFLSGGEGGTTAPSASSAAPSLPLSPSSALSSSPSSQQQQQQQQQPSHASSSPSAFAAPPALPLLASETARSQLALHPYMNALWILGAGRNAGDILKQLAAQQNAAASSHPAAPDGAPAASSAQRAQLYGDGAQYDSFAALLDAACVCLVDQKSAVLAELTSLQPSLLEESLQTFLLQQALSSASDAAQLQSATSGEALRRPPMPMALPPEEYAFSEAEERFVGLASSSNKINMAHTHTPAAAAAAAVASGGHTATAAAVPLQPAMAASAARAARHDTPVAIVPVAVDEHAAAAAAALVPLPDSPRADDDDSAAAAALVPLPDSSPASAVHSRASTPDSLQRALRQPLPPTRASTPPPAPERAEEPLPAPRPAALVRVRIDVGADARVALHITSVPSPSSSSHDERAEPIREEPPRAEERPADAPQAEEPQQPAATAVQQKPALVVTEAAAVVERAQSALAAPVPASAQAPRRGSADGFLHTLSAPSSVAPSLLRASSLGLSLGGGVRASPQHKHHQLQQPQQHVLPPIPDHARALTNMDPITLLLHLARGVSEARSYLRSMSEQQMIFDAAPLPRLSLLLSSLHARSRDARRHLEDLAVWFDAHGHELLRNVNLAREAAAAAAAAESNALTSSAQAAAAAGSAAVKRSGSGGGEGAAGSGGKINAAAMYAMSVAASAAAANNGGGAASLSLSSAPRIGSGHAPSSDSRGGASPAAESAPSPAPIPSVRELLPFSALSAMYHTARSGEQTMLYVVGLVERKKRFADLAALTRRISKLHQANMDDYVIQRRVVTHYLQEARASLFDAPSSSHSPLTFSLREEPHAVDLMLMRCLMPDSSAVPLQGGSAAGIGASAFAASTAAGADSAHAHAQQHHTRQTSSLSRHVGVSIPPLWNRSMFDHASGASVVQHLEFILRQRRQQTLQFYRVQLEEAGAGAGSAARSHLEGYAVPSGMSVSAVGLTYLGAPHAELSNKVVQPLLFHDIASLTNYMGTTLAAAAKSVIEDTFAFVASSSSALLLRRDDAMYGPSVFANPAGLHDFAQSTQWSIHDAHMLFETGRAGHALAECAQRVSDAKLVHLHSALDDAYARANAHTQEHGSAAASVPRELPPHPLSVPCVGDPLAGLRGCSFHFPSHSALSHVLDVLYSYDEALEQARLEALALQVQVHAHQQQAKLLSQSPPDVLLAWLQREENTVLAPALTSPSMHAPQTLVSSASSPHSLARRSGPLESTLGLGGGASAPLPPPPPPTQASRAALVGALTVADMEYLMHASGAGERTLNVLQSLQQSGKSFASLELLVGAVAYALNPEPQPKEGVMVTHAQLLTLLRFLSRVDRVTGPALFTVNTRSKATLSVPVGNGGAGSGGSSLASSGGGGGSSSLAAGSGADRSRRNSDAAALSDAEMSALLASGDPIVPHLYGVSLADVSSLIGAAFGTDNLIGLLREFEEGTPERYAAPAPTLMPHGAGAAAGGAPAAVTPALPVLLPAIPPRKFRSFAELKATLHAKIRSLNPYRSWVGPPAIIVPSADAAGVGSAAVLASAGGEASSPGGAGAGRASSLRSNMPLDSKLVRDIYDWLFNCSHASSALHPSASSSSSSRATCRLLEPRQLKLPVQKGDAVIWLRYEFCEAMRCVCDGGAPSDEPPSAKQTLFILRSLNDPSPTFQTFPHLAALLEQVRLTRARTDPALVEGVEALGSGAREIFSFLSAGLTGGPLASDSGGANDLPGRAEGKLGVRKNGGGAAAASDAAEERLVITNELLASLVEAGGSVASEEEEAGGGSSSSAVPLSAPPPALTILAHLSLLGEEYSRGHGAELVAAVRAQKAKADDLRRALQENIKASLASTSQHDSAGGAGGAFRKPKLIKVIPEKIATARTAVETALEDLLPRLAEVRPLLRSQLPQSLRAVSALVHRMEGPTLATLQRHLSAYTSVAITAPASASSLSGSALSHALSVSLEPFLSTLQSLFLSLPPLSKHFNAFYLILHPLHASVHVSYTQLYPLLFYLSHSVTPTPHPFVADMIAPLSDAVAALGTLRADTAQILAVQHSLTFVLERLTPLLQQVRSMMDTAALRIRENQALLLAASSPLAAAAGGAAAAAAGSTGSGEAGVPAAGAAAVSLSPPSLVDGMQPLLSLVSSTSSYLQSLLPFLSSLLATNEHHLAFLTDLLPFFEEQLRPLLPPILPLLLPPTREHAHASLATTSSKHHA